MKVINLLYIIALTLLVNFNGNAQNLLDKLNKEFSKEPVNEIATFKTTRIGLSHSIETRKKGALEISMYNRYWNRKQGTTQSFLADEVNIRFGLDYAFSDNFTVGLGHSINDKITDGFVKYKFLRQKKNSKRKPFSMAFFQEVSYRDNNPNSGSYSFYNNNSSNSSSIYSFTSQLLIARKFNSKFSMQVSPTFITRNKDFANDQSRSQFAMGFGARYKVGGHVSIVSEYYSVFNPLKLTKTYNPFMLGVNWEVSNLLLQFQMTNARNFAKDVFITQTTNNFNFHDGNFHFGFNATFVLQTNKNKL